MFLFWVFFAQSRNRIIKKGFSKAENGTPKVFVEDKNSKLPSKQVHSASDVSIMHCGTSSFYGPTISKQEE